jgi:hypothetical protein
MDHRAIAEGVAGHLLSDGFPGGPVCAAHAAVMAPRTGILLTTREPRQVWGALRAANADLKSGRLVRVVAAGDGLLLPRVRSPRHNLPRALREFLDRRGVVHSVGTCIGLRYRDGEDACIESTLADMVEVVRDSDRVLVFE